MIGLEAMKSDLLTWKDLYVSGRLHKPVRWIRQSPELTNEVKFNNQAAFAAALILSPRSFNRKVTKTILSTDDKCPEAGALPTGLSTVIQW